MLRGAADLRVSTVGVQLIREIRERFDGKLTPKLIPKLIQ